MDAGLKKEMGLWHVIGDYNHRKQEHNSLEYTDSRKCVTREGQEDGERERDEEKDETKHWRERERDLLQEDQKFRWRQRQDGGISLHHPSILSQSHLDDRFCKSEC